MGERQNYDKKKIVHISWRSGPPAASLAGPKCAQMREKLQLVHISRRSGPPAASLAAQKCVHMKQKRKHKKVST